MRAGKSKKSKGERGAHINSLMRRGSQAFYRQMCAGAMERFKKTLAGMGLKA